MGSELTAAVNEGGPNKGVLHKYKLTGGKGFHNETGESEELFQKARQELCRGSLESKSEGYRDREIKQRRRETKARENTSLTRKYEFSRSYSIYYDILYLFT